MHLRLRLRASPFVVLFALATHPLFAADSAEQIDAKLKAGGEIAWVIEDSTDKDGDRAVLFTARLKGKPPSKFSYLIHGEIRPVRPTRSTPSMTPAAKSKTAS